jgi:hypothetical protein
VPNLGSEWSPTERFLSGPAQKHPRNKAVCRCAVCSLSHRTSQFARLGTNGFKPSLQYRTAKQPAFERKTNEYPTAFLTLGGVLVEWLGLDRWRWLWLCSIWIQPKVAVCNRIVRAYAPVEQPACNRWIALNYFPSRDVEVPNRRVFSRVASDKLELITRAPHHYQGIIW